MKTSKLLILILIPLLIANSVFSHSEVRPSYRYAGLLGAEIHPGFFVSLSGAIENYTLFVQNEASSDIVEIQLLIPAVFKIISVNQVGGWKGFVLNDTAIWNGSSIEPSKNGSFPITLLNPTTISDVYTFVIIAKYRDGSMDAWRSPVEIILASKIFGIESSALAMSSIIITISLVLVETFVIKIRNHSKDDLIEKI